MAGRLIATILEKVTDTAMKLRFQIHSVGSSPVLSSTYLSHSMSGTFKTVQGQNMQAG
jgi:hypothetical protein